MILNVAYWMPLERRYAHRTDAVSTVYRDGVTLLHGWKRHIRNLFFVKLFVRKHHNPLQMSYIHVHVHVRPCTAAAVHRNAGLCSQHIPFQHGRYKRNRRTGGPGKCSPVTPTPITLIVACIVSAFCTTLLSPYIHHWYTVQHTTVLVIFHLIFQTIITGLTFVGNESQDKSSYSRTK